MSRTFKTGLVLVLTLASTVIGAARAPVAQSGSGTSVRPQGPCDIYAAAAAPCAAAHSTTRALYASYDGPLYQVMRQSDGRKLDIGVVKATAADPGGYADAAAQDRFCAGTACWIATIYDQSGHHNELTQAPRGAFSGPAMGGFNNLPIADMAPVTVMGHKVYGVFIAPGMGLRQNDAKDTAVDDQAEGQYWVINGHHYNSGCCFDYGNAEIDSKDDGNGTMETTYYGDATPWYHGTPPGPWVMTDQENNLVGCVNPDGADKLCKGLPNITWRFVTAMAKGEPHHWSSLGGDAQKGPLQVMFDGGRVDNTYDPMRKQGAILLGNGGDNSVGSQGTFYEGAMTKGGTFPSHATDQLVQANVVAAHYDVAPVAIFPARAGKPTGVQTFAPSVSQDVTVSFTNIGTGPASGVQLSLALPASWTAAASGVTRFASVAPGASVSATFKVTTAKTAFNGDLTGKASWRADGQTRSETALEKVRNASPVRINEFRIGDPTDPTNAFIELYNAGGSAVDISGWALTQHQTQQAIFSDIKIPAGTALPPKGFYVLGLATSGLAAPAKAGDTVIHVRSVAGLKAGDTIRMGGESRKIASVGTAAAPATTLWQPLPEGPVITIAAGATNVPVASVEGFAVGQKIALGHGATYPAVARTREQMEMATVTAVGKPGTLAFLATDAVAGAANIKVSRVADISVGDKIRLDIASNGHGVETVTVKTVGTAALRDVLAADARAGATSLTLRPGGGTFNTSGSPTTPPAVGDTLILGMPGALETVTITATNGATIEVRPALSRAHASGDPAVIPGTGLDLAAPLKFNHAANLPFSARGTGIAFAPAAKFAHSSNEPVQALGTGVTLDRPLTGAHPIDAAVQDGTVTTAGYQGSAPNQWFGGPALSTSAGAMVLRDATGLVVDSLNYGLLVDPWASKGYQAASGSGEGGCRVAVPGAGRSFGPAGPVLETNRSAGRFPDGADSDSNCTDFVLQPAASLPLGASAGTVNLKVASVVGFAAGQTVMIDTDASRETAVIAAVGTAGATRTSEAADKGATVLAVASVAGFGEGQAVTIGDGASRETAVIAALRGGRNARITIAAPLAFAHPADAEVSGSGITLATALGKAHAAGAQVATDLPTPGAPNKYAGPR